MIAILMATYNGEKYLSEQIDSIINQSFEDYMIYIHDDGSMDETPRIIQNYKDKYPDKIQVIEGTRTGSSKDNFFYLLDKVDSDYYMFSDQDDVWLKDKIEKSYKKIKELENSKGKRPVAVFTDMKVVDEGLNVIAESFEDYNKLDPYHTEFNRLVVQNAAAGCTMIFNRAAAIEARKHRQVKQQEAVLMHDWWIILVAASMGQVAYIDEPLSLYRQHSDNSVGAVKETGLKKAVMLLWWTVSLTHVGRTKERINHFVEQGSQLDIYDLKGENKKIVRGLSKFYEMNKIEKIRFVRRFKLYRNKRNLWQQICL